MFLVHRKAINESLHEFRENVGLHDLFYMLYIENEIIKKEPKPKGSNQTWEDPNTKDYSDEINGQKM